MKITFNYKVTPINDTVIVAISEAEITINTEQYKRLMKSQMTREYEYMDQDPILKDIVEMAYKKAVEIEAKEEYGHLVGTEVAPTDFEYPFDFEAMNENESLLLAYRPWID